MELVVVADRDIVNTDSSYIFYTADLEMHCRVTDR